MIFYKDELLVRIWLHGCGHASGTVRTLNTQLADPGSDVVSTYISWWPGQEDFNKHGTPFKQFKMRTAGPNASYFSDKRSETGASTQQRYQQNQNAFVPRGNQAISNDQDISGNPLVETLIVTKPARIVNLPGMGATAHYAHQKHGVFNVKTDEKDVEVQGKIARGEKLPAGQQALWGLNLTQMLLWWQRYLNDPKNGYQYASTKNNCAGVMTEALIAGGVESYVKLKSALVYRTPADVRDLVLSLEGKLDDLNIRSLAFIQKYGPASSNNLMQTMKVAGQEIFNLAQFKTASASPKMGFRREQISNMDSALQSYHKYVQWTPENYSKRIGSLVLMMENVFSHLENKPTSDRRAGVEKLGCQIINMLLDNNSSLNTFLQKDSIGNQCVISNFIREANYPATVTEGVKAKNRG